jgi:hypothetical protein
MTIPTQCAHRPLLFLLTTYLLLMPSANNMPNQTLKLLLSSAAFSCSLPSFPAIHRSDFLLAVPHPCSTWWTFFPVNPHLLTPFLLPFSLLTRLPTLIYFSGSKIPPSTGIFLFSFSTTSVPLFHPLFGGKISGISETN